jgi:hypothetical protein
MKDAKMTVAAGVLVTLCALIGFTAVATAAKKDASRKSSESTVTTNENGSVSRVFTECTVSTNGNMVTERRRETRTTMDTAGNVLESSTSEYAQSYSAGDTGVTPLSATLNAPGDTAAANAESFLGLKFGETFAGTNFVSDADEPTLLRTTFKPKKPLAGFDDYYVYVTPKTHKVVKVFACAKEALEPGARWRRHYLIEALEKRYRTWARLCSYRRPLYAFDIGSGRYATVCLAGATRDYETVVAAWDDTLLSTAAEEQAALREQARKAAAARRAQRVTDAADAF